MQLPAFSLQKIQKTCKPLVYRFFMATKNVSRVINALFVFNCKLTAESWQLSLRSSFLPPVHLVPGAFVGKVEQRAANVG